jgi:hypothetical protein
MNTRKNEMNDNGNGSNKLKKMRSPEHAVVCVSLPRIMKNAIARRARQRDMNVSTMIRDWLLPTLLDRDEQFAREWELRMNRIKY